MLSIQHKTATTVKFNNSTDFIPISLRFEPTLHHPAGLKSDADTIKEIEEWKDEIFLCKKNLTKRIKRQVDRNNRFQLDEYKKKTIRDIISLCALVEQREKIVKETPLSSANYDIIAKGALINFIDSLPWIDKLDRKIKNNIDDDDDLNIQPILKIIFKGTAKEAATLCNDVCIEGTTIEKIKPILHSDERKKICQSLIEGKLNTYNEFVAANQTQQSTDQAPTNMVTPVREHRINIATTRKIINDAHNSAIDFTDPPITNTNNTPINNNNIKLIWDGVKLSNQKSPVNNNTLYNIWKKIEEKAYAESEDNLTQRGDVIQEEVNASAQDRLLVDQVMFWMMKVFPTLLTMPFIIMQQNFLKNKGDTQLDGAIKSDDAHNLARAVEERMEKEMEESLNKNLPDDANEKISVNKSELQKMIRAAALTLQNQTKRKNISETATTSTRRSTLDGGNGNANGKRVKFTKANNQTPKTPPTKKVVNPKNTYNNNKKSKNQPSTAQTPNITNQKNDYRRGRRKKHQNVRHTQGRGARDRGRGGRRNTQSGRGQRSQR